MSSEFDIIFAGGGTTACVIAGRLIAADPSLKILVVERGQHSRDVPIHVQPCRFMQNIAPSSITTYTHRAKPSGQLNGRALVVRSGKCVGGGSAVNFMVYTRGAASDYDDWARFGNEGWNFTKLLPLIKKAETFSPQVDQVTHGYDGPVQISAGHVEIGIAKEFLDVGKAYEPHRPQVKDNNDFKTANAYSSWNRYVNPKTGRRSDAASAYLYPHAQNPNLEIQVGMCVKRVIVKNGRAVGIEYTSDATPTPGAAANVIAVTASKLVVVSAGAFGSPTILERSGVGNSSILTRNNVPVVVDLPGVGENYRDHVGGYSSFYASDDANTMDDILGNPTKIAANLAEWEASGTGKIAHTGFDAMMKFRPTASELASIGPTFQPTWQNFFERNPDKPVALIAPFAGFLGNRSLLPPSSQKYLSMEYYLWYPLSVGSVHLTSGEDVNASPTFESGFLSEAGDIACLTLLYKRGREIARRMPSYRGEVAFCHPSFAPDSPAVCQKVNGPVPINAPDIAYSIEDDEIIEEYHRKYASTIWHSLGTCSMKPREQGGVVDSRLNVYGVKNLKIADLSICPSNVGNNTYSTALLIGEKAAVIIAQDLGINIASTSATAVRL